MARKITPHHLAAFAALLCVKRPAPLREYDQLPVTPETLVRRVLLLAKNRLAFGQSFLFLGDDDFTSVAVSRFLRPQKVVVLEIDDRIIKSLRLLSKEYSLNLAIIRHDMVDTLPPSCAGNFDICFTDPPYTPAGQLMFANRALTALRLQVGSTLYLAASRLYLNSLQIESILGVIQNAGLQLSAIYEDFNEYHSTPDVLEDMRKLGLRSTESFKSDLFHLVAQNNEISPELVPVPFGDIYKYEEINAPR